MGRSKIHGKDLILKLNSDGKRWEFLPDKNQIRCLPCGMILEYNFRQGLSLMKCVSHCVLIRTHLMNERC